MKYYLHDTSAFDDEKVSELFINFGYEGVGLFYVILEKLGKQEKPVKTEVLKRQLRVGKKLEKCWSFMEQIGLISSNNGDTFNKQLLNFSEKYQIKKEKTRIKVSEWRKNQEDIENVTSYVPECNPPKVKESKVNNIPLWKKDYAVYRKVCSEGFGAATANEKFIEKLKLYNPNLNIMKTIQKMFDDFWILEDGWLNKKKTKTANINWQATISNSMQFHKVYYTKQELDELGRK